MASGVIQILVLAFLAVTLFMILRMMFSGRRFLSDSAHREWITSSEKNRRETIQGFRSLGRWRFIGLHALIPAIFSLGLQPALNSISEMAIIRYLLLAVPGAALFAILAGIRWSRFPLIETNSINDNKKQS